jgi:hypothetical protein
MFSEPLYNIDITSQVINKRTASVLLGKRERTDTVGVKWMSNGVARLRVIDMLHRASSAR